AKKEVEHTNWDALDREMEDIRKRKKKWQLAFANDAITLEDLKERTQEENVREEAIRLSMNQISASIVESPSSNLTPEDIMKFATELKKNWSFLELEHRKLAIHS